MTQLLKIHVWNCHRLAQFHDAHVDMNFMPFFGCQWPKTPFIIIIKRKNNNDEHFLSVFPPNDYCNLEIYDIVHEKY